MYRLPALLVIMDGLGWADPSQANAVSLARTPYLDSLIETYPFTTLGASGPDVGLPEGQMGNSEVGHLNIGAGRVVMQDLMRINHAIQTATFFSNEALLGACRRAAQHKTCVHIMGLVSDGGVHSHIDHCLALIRLACEQSVSRIRIHAFLDGRDVSPDSGLEYIRSLSRACANVSEQSACDCRIADVCGRYYAMDRDNRWDRVRAAWDVMVHGRTELAASAAQGVADSYARGVFDEFVEPFACEHSRIDDGDVVIFFNFRPDRARELSRAFTEHDFSAFDRGRVPQVTFVSMTCYDPLINCVVAYPKENPDDVLADVIARAGLRQYHTAETEKYAHVTFFLNGGVEDPKPREQRVLVASPKVATYDLQPEMSAFEVASKLVDAIEHDTADFYIVNFANPDMVGHTGVLEAAVKAVEVCDTCMGQAVEAIRKKSGVAIVSADHGNADCMFVRDPQSGDCRPVTSHTLARVPCIVVADGVAIRPDVQGRLCDLAPTLIDLVGLEKPQSWTGTSLVIRT